MSRKLKKLMVFSMVAVLSVSSLASGMTFKTVVHAEQSLDEEDFPDEDTDSNWDSSVIVISSAEDLIGLSKQQNNTFAGETIVLDADIQLDNINEFAGICTDSYYSFQGTFDGCGHSISGINLTGKTAMGLFGYVGQGGIVKNVTIKDAYISTNKSFGTVARKIKGGTINNCHVENTTLAYTGTADIPDNYVGGIVGNPCNSSQVINCSFDGEISSKGYHVGGIVGFTNDGNGAITIANCVNHGAVTGYNRVGGIVGYTTRGKVVNCYNTGTIAATQKNNEHVGAFVGSTQTNATIQYCYALQGSCDRFGDGTGTYTNNAFLQREEMLADTFADTLNNNIKNSNQYLSWIYQEGQYPSLQKVININDCNISFADSSIVYNGKKQEPRLIVTDQSGGEEITLINNKDYKTYYSNNKNAGVASVRIQGLGIYVGSKKVNFQISEFDLSKCILNLDKEVFYYSTLEQTPSVKIMGVNLVKNVDYIVQYQNNVKVGEATVIVSGIGSCVGEKTKTFKISPQRISACKIVMNKSSYTYSGKEIKPGVQLMNSKYYSLTKGRDYTVKYFNNKLAGTASIVITGCGNYTGQTVKTFVINKASQKLKYQKKYSVKKKKKTVKLNVSRIAGDGKLFYQSSNKKVVTVSKKGVMRLKKKGTATITVKAATTRNYRTKSVKIKVKVK